jgi:NADH:ubiquinone oxidoreductase subunit 6 (subunit J)
MSVFRKFLLVNGLLMFVHPMLFFAGIMGFGSAPDYTPKIELFKAMLSLAFVGACPNLLVFIISAFRRKEIKENLIWALIFFSLVFIVYLAVFWSVLK